MPHYQWTGGDSSHSCFTSCLRMKSEAQRFLTMLTSEMLSMLSTCTSMPTGMAAPETKTQERFKLINHRSIQSEMFSFSLRWDLWRSHTHTYLELHLHFWHFASCISGSQNFKWLLNNVNCHIKLQITSNIQDSVRLNPALLTRRKSVSETYSTFTWKLSKYLE